MIELLLVFISALITTYLMTPVVAEKLKHAGLVGGDVNKADKPEIPNMGGFTVVGGFTMGMIVAIAITTYLGLGYEIQLILGGMCVVLIMSIAGIFDDLCLISQKFKAALPIFAALPLVAVKAGVTNMQFPLIGEVDFGILYMLIIIPFGIAGASNVANMFAGFNGLEAGLGFIITATVGMWGAVYFNSMEAAILCFAMAGALLGFLPYNRYPAKVFIGDVGTLSIGAVVACSAIIGNYEFFAMLLMGLYYIDFGIKALNKFPSSEWWGKIGKDGKLHHTGKVKHFAQLIMKITGGIHEKKLVSLFLKLQILISMTITIIISNKLG